MLKYSFNSIKNMIHEQLPDYWRHADPQMLGKQLEQLTSFLYIMANSSRPTHRMDEGTPHVTPEVITAIAVLIKKPQPATDHRIHHSHTCPRNTVLIYYLQSHALAKWVLHVLSHLS